MPELPEAETIARGLREPLLGRRIRGVEILHPDLLDDPPERFSETLVGSRIRSVGRRGKNLVLGLGSRPADGVDTGGATSEYLVVNLGMSGRLHHRAGGVSSDPPSHPGVRFTLDGGGRLVYHDVRRFGRLRVMDAEAYAAWSASLGSEPLSPEFTGPVVHDVVRRSRAPIRSLLLDQRRVAGVGNIYANEALFRAGVHPRRAANTLEATEAHELRDALRAVLAEAVEARGTTLRDYRTAQGRRGTFVDRLRVYGREGLPCTSCDTSVERIVFGGRSAFLCPRCQPEANGSA